MLCMWGIGVTGDWESGTGDGPEGRVHEVYVLCGAEQHGSPEGVCAATGSGGSEGR